MKKFFGIYLIAALFAFAAVPACGGKDGPDLPPPDWHPTDPGDDPGDDPGNPGQEDPPDDNPHSGPWDENRGKIVTPTPGKDGWTSSTVRDGIIYYHLSGTESVSNAKQEVFVVDVDMTNPKYEVQLTRYATAQYVSTVHAEHNAIATINAGYEAGSIFIRCGGRDYSIIPNVEIGTTGQDNWKSEGAFYIDNNGNPGTVFVGSPKRDGVVSGIKGGTYAEAVKKQRTYYQSMSKATYPYLLSSAPLMIDDFEPLGETFCDYQGITETQAKNLNSENLEHHQRVRHPRTAVAITEHKHLLLIVVDGRRTSRQGMSCRELTDFLIKWFNPQYAINLDGGGSSAMCVEGLGNSKNVVNSPIDGGTSGQERARDTQIIIVPK